MRCEGEDEEIEEAKEDDGCKEDDYEEEIQEEEKGCPDESEFLTQNAEDKICMGFREEESLHIAIAQTNTADTAVGQAHERVVNLESFVGHINILIHECHDALPHVGVVPGI